MKNKSEKLARNAIRARKAKNKRANEQDKPKKGKRWLIRLGTIMGCLLLVSALVVPCFADFIYYPTYTITDDYYTAFLEYNVADIVQDSDVFMDLVNYYRRRDHSNGWKGLFANHLLCYSKHSYDDDMVRHVDARLSEDSVLYGEVMVEHIDFNIKARDGVGDGLSYAFDVGKFMYDIRSNGDDVFLIVDFRADFDFNDYQIIFTAYDYTYSSDEQVEFEGGTYTFQIYEDDVLIHSAPLGTVEVAYTVQDSFLGPLTLQSVSLLHDVLFTPNLYSYYHPLAFANGYFGGQMETGTYADGYNNGYSSGYNTGKNEGYTLGYNDGHDVGYEKGEEEGYNIGYEAGADVGLEEGYDLGYMEGYDVGYDVGYGTVVDSSASANLGKNLLGDTLSAPFAVLKSIPIVEWETATGTVSITVYSLLMALIGFTLVVWFLKMFAGG